jgi:hypothetical protein
VSRTDHHLPVKYRLDELPLMVSLGRGRGSNTLSTYANRLERRARAELRTFTLLITGTCRSGGDIERFIEPDARTRHRAHWDFW